MTSYADREARMGQATTKMPFAPNRSEEAPNFSDQKAVDTRRWRLLLNFRRVVVFRPPAILLSVVVG